VSVRGRARSAIKITAAFQLNSSQALSVDVGRQVLKQLIGALWWRVTGHQADRKMQGD